VSEKILFGFGFSITRGSLGIGVKVLAYFQKPIIAHFIEKANIFDDGDDVISIPPQPA
jgi:hypothetical protein